MKKLICSVLCLFFIGCATITIDGRPIAEHIYSQRNPSTGLRIDLLFVRYKEIKEGEEKFEWPVYLELNRLEKIPNDTKRVGVVLQIVNPYEVEYMLELWCREYNKEIKTTRKIISKSSFPNRIHEIDLNMKEDIMFEYFLRLVDEEGNLIMEMGNAEYIIKIDYMKILKDYYSK